MSALVCSGARLLCTFGQGISTLIAPPRGTNHPSGRPLATTSDHQPVSNITPFSQCAAPPVLARAALSGSPPLCVPRPTGAWSPNAQGILIGTLPALTGDAVLSCAEGGLLTIQDVTPSGVSYSASLPSNR